MNMNLTALEQMKESKAERKYMQKSKRRPNE